MVIKIQLTKGQIEKIKNLRKDKFELFLTDEQIKTVADQVEAIEDDILNA